jgi:hypothetical protein
MLPLEMPNLEIRPM